MIDKDRDDEMAGLVRSEVGGWSPGAPPNMHDVLTRADSGWQRPVVAYSGVAAAALAVVLVVALVFLLLGSHFTLADQVKDRLLAH